MEKINLEFKLAEDYLTTMHEHSGANKEDCQNVQMHLDNIYELIKNLNLPVVMPRYFIDKRAGCAAVRDREHPKYNKDYEGLHQDTPDVVVYAHGFQNHEKGCWELKIADINYLKLECDRLNNCSGA